MTPNDQTFETLRPRLLALAYRSWALAGNDEVQDDDEDRRIMRLADRDEGPGTQDVDR